MTTRTDLKAASDEELLLSTEQIIKHLRRTSGRNGEACDAGGVVATNLALELALESQARLRETHERIAHLERLAVTDEMTGVLNRRGFEQRLHEVMAHATRHDAEGVLIYIDLNDFKPINDTYGHDAGDEVLRQVARLLHRATRETDIIGRLGGDEFGIILTHTSAANGLLRAQELSRALNSSYANWCGEMIGISASFGAQPFKGGDDCAEVLSAADRAMYGSKAARQLAANEPEDEPALQRAFA